MTLIYLHRLGTYSSIFCPLVYQQTDKPEKLWFVDLVTKRLVENFKNRSTNCSPCWVVVCSVFSRLLVNSKIIFDFKWHFVETVDWSPSYLIIIIIKKKHIVETHVLYVKTSLRERPSRFVVTNMPFNMDKKIRCSSSLDTTGYSPVEDPWENGLKE